MQGRLAGKVAVVTGSTMGIGWEIARRFMAEGARVVVNSRTAERVEQAVKELNTDDTVVGFTGDVSDEHDATAPNRATSCNRCWTPRERTTRRSSWYSSPSSSVRQGCPGVVGDCGTPPLGSRPHRPRWWSRWGGGSGGGIRVGGGVDRCGGIPGVVSLVVGLSAALARLTAVVVPDSRRAWCSTSR
jgi:hypothetical protein